MVHYLLTFRFTILNISVVINLIVVVEMMNGTYVYDRNIALRMLFIV